METTQLKVPACQKLLSGIIGNRPEENYPVKSQSAKLRPACVCVPTIVARGDKDKTGPGQQCNHKMCTGLPDAGNRRLFRSSMMKPFSRSHCPVPCRGLGVKLLHILSRHEQGSVCTARIIIHRSVIVLRPLSRSTCGENTGDLFGSRRIKSGIRRSGSTQPKRHAGMRTRSTHTIRQPTTNDMAGLPSER